ncbi:hypothetical protein [Pyrococcus sp. ST04]|uniref:hypothetical protein n=1 Tax=Pyrococcus sp. ST04 TaxID=1183377 RepID=UPI0002605CAA|nr:hypothetical protein [Pyrococcus sp. ST04]AFK22996.1 hypothetical protein Py04_1424 [Pyrococcus sp. ST04]
MKITEKQAGLALYIFGIGLAVIRPPVERLACINLVTGEVCRGINPFFLILEIGLIMSGAVFLMLSQNFYNVHERNGWLGVVTGLGIAFVGGYSGLRILALFGITLATIGLLMYKYGRVKNERR